MCKHASVLLRLSVQEEQSPKTMGKGKGSVGVVDDHCEGGAVGGRKGPGSWEWSPLLLVSTWRSWSWTANGWRRWWRRWAERSHCGLTPGWSWNPCGRRQKQRTGEQTHTPHRAANLKQHQSNRSLPAISWTMQLEEGGGGVTLWHTRLRLDRTATTTNSAAGRRGLKIDRGPSNAHQFNFPLREWKKKLERWIQFSTTVFFYLRD